MAYPNCLEPLFVSLRTTETLTSNKDDAFSQVLYHLNVVLNARARGEPSDSEMYESAVDELLECIKINESRMCEDEKNVALLNFAKSFSAFDHNLLDSFSSNSSNVSEQDSLDDRDDGMEGIEQMTFDDLPDIVIMQIFDRLDIRSRHKMREVSKRMHGIQLKVKNNLEKIRFKFVGDSSAKLTVAECGFESVTIQENDNYGLEHVLSRLAANSHVKKIQLVIQKAIEEEDSTAISHLKEGAILELFKTDADELEVTECKNDYAYHIVPMLPSFAQKFRRMSMNLGWARSPQTAPMLYLIREMMIEGNCKLESFIVHTNVQVRGELIRECFGIAFQHQYFANCTAQWSLSMIRALDELVEIYVDESCHYVCFEQGHFRTTLDIEGSTFTFEKCDDGSKPGDNYEKVEMNQQYELDYWEIELARLLEV